MTRRVVRGVAAWVFGLATTIFLIAVWGRAVVIDVNALQEAAAPLASSGAVVEIFTEWLDAELAEVGVDPTTSELVIEDVLDDSAVGAAIGRFAGELVLAAAAPGPVGAAVDVARLLQPAVPEIGDALASAGVAVSEARVAELVADLDPLVVRAPDAEPYIGAASPTAARLGVAALLSLVVMVVSGWAALAAADNRFTEARGLLHRAAIGAFSFAIILRAGSWVLDPRGGRAPLAESASVVAGSKWLIPFSLAVVAGAAATLIWLFRQRAVSPTPDEPPTPQPELETLRSG